MKLKIGEWIVLAGAVTITAFAGTVGAMIYKKPPPVKYVNVESSLGKQGEKIFKREFCLSCHEVFAIGATYGPNLDGVGSRRSKAWLNEYLRAPRPGVSIKPYRLKMPPYDSLPASEMTALVAYLEGLREVDENMQPINPSG